MSKTPLATKKKFKHFHDTVSTWLDAYQASRTQRPLIYPIFGESEYGLIKSEYEETNGHVELTLTYSSEDELYSLTLSSNPYIGDEIIAVGPNNIRFSEYDVMGVIFKGQPLGPVNQREPA